MYLCVLSYYWFPCISPRCNETLVFLTQDHLLNEICNLYQQRYCYLALFDPLLCNKYTVDEMFSCFNLFPMRPVPVLSNVHHLRTSLSTTSINSDLKLDLCFHHSKICFKKLRSEHVVTEPATQDCFSWKQSPSCPGRGEGGAKSLAWESEFWQHENIREYSDILVSKREMFKMIFWKSSKDLTPSPVPGQDNYLESQGTQGQIILKTLLGGIGGRNVLVHIFFSITLFCPDLKFVKRFTGPKISG